MQPEQKASRTRLRARPLSKKASATRLFARRLREIASPLRLSSLARGAFCPQRGAKRVAREALSSAIEQKSSSVGAFCSARGAKIVASGAKSLARGAKSLAIRPVLRHGRWTAGLRRDGNQSRVTALRGCRRIGSARRGAPPIVPVLPARWARTRLSRVERHARIACPGGRAAAHLFRSLLR